MMGCCPKCYISSFVKIGLPVQEKNIFECFYHIWAWRPSWSCDLGLAIKLSLPLPMDAAHKINFTLIGQAVSEKIFEKCVWTTDRPRSRDDVDLN